MKNYIAYDIDLSKIPINIRKTFIIDDFLIKEKILVKENNEELVNIKTNKDIRVKAFWEDKINYNIEDKELRYLINLEWNLLQEYMFNNPDFCIKVRKTVYKKLIKVSKYLKDKWYILIIKIWYRPLEVQKKLFNEVYKYIEKKHNNLEKTEIYKITCDYVSDPDNFIPPHSTWWAIDLMIEDLEWNQIDMWSPINYPWEESNITYDKISLKQKQNRDILFEAMIKFWFASLASEWWHFSYWDQIWAYFYWKKEAIYWKIANI